MVETPFSTRSKPYWDRNECPSIHVSNDGIHWEEPYGFINPLIDLAPEQIDRLCYYSDPHLVSLPDNSIELWFRLTDRNGERDCEKMNVSLLRMTSTNGINWSEKKKMVDLDSQSGTPLGGTVVSPAVLYFKESYLMWYVDVEKPNEAYKRGVSFSTSPDGKLWAKRETVSFDKPINPWHIDVKKIGNTYYMLVYDRYNLTLWKSDNGLCFSFIRIILNPSKKFGSFYRELYRACLVTDEKEFKIYFSGWDLIDTHIGLLRGTDWESMRIERNGALNFQKFLVHYYLYNLRRSRFIFRNLTKKLLNSTKH